MVPWLTALATLEEFLGSVPTAYSQQSVTSVPGVWFPHLASSGSELTWLSTNIKINKTFKKWIMGLNMKCSPWAHVLIT